MKVDKLASAMKERVSNWVIISNKISNDIYWVSKKNAFLCGSSLSIHKKDPEWSNFFEVNL